MKILKIENCGSCPYLRWSWKTDACVKKDNKKIKDIKIIPKWCPLEDYKDE